MKSYLDASKDDPIVPAGAFIGEAKALGNRLRFRYFKASGHDGFLTEPRVWKDLEARSARVGRCLGGKSRVFRR